MPRHNNPRPRRRLPYLMPEPEPDPTPDTLARRLVSRGLASPCILGSEDHSSRANSDADNERNSHAQQ